MCGRSLWSICYVASVCGQVVLIIERNDVACDVIIKFFWVTKNKFYVTERHLLSRERLLRVSSERILDRRRVHAEYMIRVLIRPKKFLSNWLWIFYDHSIHPQFRWSDHYRWNRWWFDSSSIWMIGSSSISLMMIRWSSESHQSRPCTYVAESV